MSYLTLEVEIDHGKVVAKEPAKLPDKASGLLTIFQPDEKGQSKLSPLQALDGSWTISRITTDYSKSFDPQTSHPTENAPFSYGVSLSFDGYPES